MPRFGPASQAQLATCHPDIQRLFAEIVKTHDCSIIEGHRGQEAQEAAFKTGASTKHYPEGRHNSDPSEAADVAPYPIDWGNIPRFLLFAGFVLGVADQLGIPIRYGGDWNGNGDPRDEHLHDYVHFELAQKKGPPEGSPDTLTTA